MKELHHQVTASLAEGSEPPSDEAPKKERPIRRDTTILNIFSEIDSYYIHHRRHAPAEWVLSLQPFDIIGFGPARKTGFIAPVNTETSPRGIVEKQKKN